MDTLCAGSASASGWGPRVQRCCRPGCGCQGHHRPGHLCPVLPLQGEQGHSFSVAQSTLPFATVLCPEQSQPKLKYAAALPRILPAPDVWLSKARCGPLWPWRLRASASCAACMQTWWGCIPWIIATFLGSLKVFSWGAGPWGACGLYRGRAQSVRGARPPPAQDAGRRHEASRRPRCTRFALLPSKRFRHPLPVPISDCGRAPPGA